MVDPKILVCVPTLEYGRFAAWHDYYNQLDLPLGTIKFHPHGQSPAANRNLGIKAAKDNNCTHIFFLDDDVLIRPDALTRLLAHDKDVVSGLYYMRHFPHNPIIFDYVAPDGRCRTAWLSPDKKGLIPIVAAGLGLCLIKVSVFDKLESPYIRLGELDPENWGDDIGFFNRLYKAGVPMYCDLDVRGGHVGTAAFWPDYKDGLWMTNYDTSGTQVLSAYQPYPREEEKATWNSPNPLK